ncbi:pitrilysin family protein [Ottowia sp. oral taxon 894]|uniref:M16 family metallopeptidase n=1 Tax=Ottowia sp. oral taxon 894 TaxID=1658672 RepID=UPI0009E46568|nr:pitrilysin family protein [Ottowia sp. oral taxon 894]
MTFTPSFRAAAVALLLAGGAVLHGCASHPETSQTAQTAQAPQAAPDAQQPPQPPNVLAQVAAGVYQARLDNGLTLIVKPDRRSPVAVQMLWVRVGSIDEVDGASGIAHMLEHMMFKGTKQLGPGEISRRVALLGGRDNAFTTSDYTAYFQQVPAAALPQVMALQADSFENNQWPDDEFTREMAVVKEERRLRTDDQPRARLYEQQMAAAFVASPYHRPVIGWMGDLDSMTADDVRAFRQSWYVPANAAVVVAGDVDPAAVLALAQKTYGRIPARAVPGRKPRPEPQQHGPRRLELRAPAEQAVVSLVFKVPGLQGLAATPENDDALALTVLAAVLDGYQGARLERALVQGKDRVADSVNADNGLMGRGPQLFSLLAVPAKGRTPAQAEAALRAEVARIAREGVGQAELERVKTQWIAGQVYKRDSVMAQAQELGSYWALGLPLDADEKLIERLRAVTPAQVQAVARQYFGDEQMTAATLAPQSLKNRPRPRPAPAGLRH